MGWKHCDEIAFVSFAPFVVNLQFRYLKTLIIVGFEIDFIRGVQYTVFFIWVKREKRL